MHAGPCEVWCIPTCGTATYYDNLQRRCTYLMQNMVHIVIYSAYTYSSHVKYVGMDGWCDLEKGCCWLKTAVGCCTDGLVFAVSPYWCATINGYVDVHGELKRLPTYRRLLSCGVLRWLSC